MAVIQNFLNSIVSVFRCRTVAALLLFLLVNIAIDCWRPLRNFAVDGRPFLDQHSYFNKSAELSWRKKSPDVLILGSSLAMCAIATADYSLMQKPYPLFFSADFTTYCDAKCIRQEVGLPLSFFNYSCPGYLISHDLQLLAEVLSKGSPKLIVIMVAPRDFIDNLLYAQDSPRSESEPVEKAIARLLRLYAVRGDFAYLFKKYIRSIYENRSIAWQAVLSKRTIDTPLSKYEMYEDEATYMHRYNPLNWKRYKVQVQCFELMLANCRSKKVPVLVVNMPLPQFNLKLLEPDFYRQYMDMLQEKAKYYGADFLDLQSGDYTAADFRDYAHLRHTGGLKCCRAIAQEVRRILQGNRR